MQGEYECEIEADGDRPISVRHTLDILVPPRVTAQVRHSPRHHSTVLYGTVCSRGTGTWW